MSVSAGSWILLLLDGAKLAVFNVFAKLSYRAAGWSFNTESTHARVD